MTPGFFNERNSIMKTKNERLSELKELLTMAIESTSNWRMEKTEEHPEDADRNEMAAEALKELCEYVETEIPVDHELFLLEYEIGETSNDDLMHDFGISRNDEIRKHGFQNRVDPETWIEEQVEEMKYLIKNYRHKQMESNK